MSNKTIKIFSFFSGSGFLDLGFENTGYNVIFVNEFNSEFMKAHQFARLKMHMPPPVFGYHNVDANIFLNDRRHELEKYLLYAGIDESLIGFIGGPPCPDFSVGGKNRGRDGERGQLSLTYVNLITQFQPDFFLFENVKGLWKTAKHREFFEELKDKLHAASYHTWERLTNALEYGVPQDRDRILLFGVKKSLVRGEFVWEKYQRYSVGEVKGRDWPKTDPYREDGVLECPTGLLTNLTVQHWFDKNDVEHHPNTKDFFTPKAGYAKMTTIAEGDVCKKSYKRLHRWRYSPTVAYGNNEVHLHPYKSRRLSVAEALALQSLPKEFQLPPDMSLTNKFKTVGNGVPYLLALGIAKTIQDYLLA